MKASLPWSRRRFLQTAGCTSLGIISTSMGLPASADSRQHRAIPIPRFAYVGYGNDADPLHEIGVFAIDGDRWIQVEAIPSRHPSSLVLHPIRPYLYVANEVDQHEYLPSGTVEAYRIDERNGRLTLLNRQALSLSATLPRHLAISPDGTALVAAVHGGGAYNVLPIRDDGSVGRVAGILKETGAGPDVEHQRSAHPQMTIFDGTGQLLCADMGSDRLSVLHLHKRRFGVSSRGAAQSGSGPHQLALHPDNRLLFVAGALDASVTSYRYHQEGGRIAQPLHRVSLVRGQSHKTCGTALMAMHSSGKYLYTALRNSLGDGVTVWHICAKTGALRPLQTADTKGEGLHAMIVSPDSGKLLALNRREGAVISWNISGTDGRLGQAAQVAQVTAPMSLAVKYL